MTDTSEPFAATSFMPPEVSAKGDTISVMLVNDAAEQVTFTLPAAVTSPLINALQQAYNTAQERFHNRPTAAHGAVRMVVQQPTHVLPRYDELSGRAVLVFDQGKLSEMAYALPMEVLPDLAKMLLAIVEHARQPPQAMN
jgi:hypothetical protein